ncbi:hypothetical protein [Peribacillus sp. SCS-155]|uniref:hypothetical protein n=1 Tax=Peribacillus sedimenti TaxID=3115297 RepID=UPI003905E6CF
MTMQRIGGQGIQQLNMQNKSYSSFKAGQILYGKIVKIYPHQIAEVHIGSQKLFAQLDAPLAAGGRYWLQVQPGEGKLQLKVLPSDAVAGKDGLDHSAQQILTHLSLGSTKESVELAKFLFQNQLPITKESFIKALEWLKSSDNLDGTRQTIQNMHAKNLPFIDDVYFALHSVQKEEPLHALLADLYKKMSEGDNETDVAGKLRALIGKLLGNNEASEIKINFRYVLSSWLDEKSTPGNQAAAFTQIQRAGFIPAAMTEDVFFERLMYASGLKGETFIGSEARTALHNMLQKTEISSSLLQASQTDQKPTDTSMQPNAESTPMSPKQGTALPQVKNILYNMLIDNQGSKLEQRALVNLFSAGSGQKLDPGTDARLAMLVSMDKVNNESGDQVQLPLQKLEAELVFDPGKSSSFAKLLRDIPNLLGMSLESMLTKPEINSGQLDTLKPLLMQLMHENQPNAVKDIAAQVIHRINGHQILSQEAGPLQNIFMQLPLVLGSHHTDMTIQWSGRKKKDGSIDPSFCRILFYLELEQMDITVVDMVVQNRVLKVAVINDRAAQYDINVQPFISMLKENLLSLDYKLSSVSFKSSEEAKNAENRMKAQRSKMPVPDKSYSGVDLRI